MEFGKAIEALKEGKMVAREGWNGKGLFVFMQIPSEISMDIVPKMQSLPQSVKDEFTSRAVKVADRSGNTTSITSISYSNQLALVDTESTITGWSPSTSDALSTDWIIKE